MASLDLETRLGIVKKAGINYMNMAAMHSNHQQDAFNPQIYDSFMRYVLSGLKEEQFREQYEALRNEPMKVRELMQVREKIDEKNLVALVDSDLSGIALDFPIEMLKSLALSLPGKDKKYVNIAREFQAGNKEAALLAYAECYNAFKNYRDRDDPLGEFFPGETPESIEQMAKLHVHLMKEKFLGYFYSIDKNGKKYLSKRKLAGYIVNTINSYKQKEKDKYLLEVGKIYALANKKNN